MSEYSPECSSNINRATTSSSTFRRKPWLWRSSRRRPRVPNTKLQTTSCSSWWTQRRLAHFHLKFKTQLNLAIFENCPGHPYVAYCNGQWCRVWLEKCCPTRQALFSVWIFETVKLWNWTSWKNCPRGSGAGVVIKFLIFHNFTVCLCRKVFKSTSTSSPLPVGKRFSTETF